MVVEQDGAMLRYKYARIIQGFGIWIKQGWGGRCFGWGLLLWMGCGILGEKWE